VASSFASIKEDWIEQNGGRPAPQLGKPVFFVTAEAVMPPVLRLAANTQTLDQGLVSLRTTAFQVLEHPSTASDHG
jgi:hypothetical protein